MANVPDQKMRVDASDAVAECDLFEAELAELRAAWEQYFLGIDRRPPVERHQQLRRHAQKIRSMWVRQTAAKFRVQAVIQKHVTYERLWQRTLQEIESGTYKRDVYRVQRAAAQAQAATVAPPEPPKTPTLKDLSPAEADAVLTDALEGGPGARTPAAKPLGDPLPPVRPPPLPAARKRGTEVDSPSLAGMKINGDAHAIPESKLRAVYDAYLAARRSLNEDVSKISFESVAQSLRKQVPDLMKKHNAKAVEFKVIIRDGKAVLRAVPKSG